MSATFPRTVEDAAALRSLLSLCLRPWRKHERLAEALGVERTTVTNWLGGTRAPEVHVLRAILVETARQHPHSARELATRLVREMLDLRGQWTPEAAPTTRTWLEESRDLTRLHGAIADAVEARDPAALEALAARAHLELDELLVAARREVEGT